MKNLLLKVLLIGAFLGFSSVSAIEFNEDNVVSWERPANLKNLKGKTIDFGECPKLIVANFEKRKIDENETLTNFINKNCEGYSFSIVILQKKHKLDIDIMVIILKNPGPNADIVAAFSVPPKDISVY